jgi:hypothetical protein
LRWPSEKIVQEPSSYTGRYLSRVYEHENCNFVSPVHSVRFRGGFASTKRGRHLRMACLKSPSIT